MDNVRYKLVLINIRKERLIENVVANTVIWSVVEWGRDTSAIDSVFLLLGVKWY